MSSEYISEKKIIRKFRSELQRLKWQNWASFLAQEVDGRAAVFLFTGHLRGTCLICNQEINAADMCSHFKHSDTHKGEHLASAVFYDSKLKELFTQTLKQYGYRLTNHSTESQSIWESARKSSQWALYFWNRWVEPIPAIAQKTPLTAPMRPQERREFIH